MIVRLFVNIALKRVQTQSILIEISIVKTPSSIDLAHRESGSSMFRFVECE